MRGLWATMLAALLLAGLAATAAGANDGYIYYSTGGPTAPASTDDKIVKVACDGSGASDLVTAGSSLAENQAMALASVGGVEYLYWVNGGTLYRITTDGTGSVESVSSASPAFAGAKQLVSDGSRIWWIGDSGAKLYTSLVSSVAPTNLPWSAPSEWSNPSLALASGNLYLRKAFSRGGAMYTTPAATSGTATVTEVVGTPSLPAPVLGFSVLAAYAGGTAVYGPTTADFTIARTTVGGATDATWGSWTSDMGFGLGGLAVSSGGTVIMVVGGNGDPNSIYARGSASSAFVKVQDAGAPRNLISSVAVSGACTVASVGGGTSPASDAASTTTTTTPGTIAAPFAKAPKVRKNVVSMSTTVGEPGVARLVGVRVGRRAGRAAATRAVCSARAVFAKAGTRVLRCVPNAATTARRAKAAVRVRLTLTFTPTGGTATVVSSRVVTLPRTTSSRTHR